MALQILRSYLFVFKHGFIFSDWNNYELNCYCPPQRNRLLKGSEEDYMNEDGTSWKPKPWSAEEEDCFFRLYIDHVKANTEQWCHHVTLKLKLVTTKQEDEEL